MLLLWCFNSSCCIKLERMEYEKRRVEEENKLLDPEYEQSMYTEGLSTEGEPMVVKCINVIIFTHSH